MAMYQPISDEPLPAADPLIGRVLAGRYEIRRLIGEGGMGRVYEGRQRALDRPVAVKCIHPRLLSSEQIVQRFMDEARVASHLLHPNVVKIYDFGRTEPRDGGTLFLVMELLTGRDLGRVIGEEAPFQVARAYPILKQVLGALGEAHARGVTHRDAKPENVILEPTVGGGERVKIIDFGIARVHGARGVTSLGTFIGTPHYMPPEQIRGEKAEVSSDLYAVGVMMYQMLTGELPFDAGTVTAVLELQLYGARVDPRETPRGRDCPPALARLCLRALDVDLRARHPTADAFAEALELAVAESIPSRARRSSNPPPHPGAALDVRLSDSVARRMMRSSAPPVSGDRPIDLAAVDRIERDADVAIAEGRFDDALGALNRGVSLGLHWYDAGENEVGGAVLTAFGRRMGVVLRDLGRLEESLRALKGALTYSLPEELSRARILTELVATHADLGRPADAEVCRVEALRIANAEGDRDLILRLRRFAQELSISISGMSAAESEAVNKRTAPPDPPELGSRPQASAQRVLFAPKGAPTRR